MRNQRLSRLIFCLGNLRIVQPADPQVTAIVYDSRDVQPGALFFALKGIHAFINAAAAAIMVHSDAIPNPPPGIPCIQMPDTPLPGGCGIQGASVAVHESCRRNRPGTDGKTTNVWLIRQLQEITGASTGSIATVNFSVGGQTDSNIYRQSTPDT